MPPVCRCIRPQYAEERRILRPQFTEEKVFHRTLEANLPAAPPECRMDRRTGFEAVNSALKRP